eukprot:scpid1236/ scgid27488/ Cytoplasmic dynein 2 heavy chain 1; Dynein heavy chain isotype 1B
MSGDSRKDLLLKTAADYFGVEPNDPNMLMLLTTEELNNFLDDGNCTVLVLSYFAQHVPSGVAKDDVQSTWSVKLSNRSKYDDSSADKLLVFFKVMPVVITPDNLHSNIFISSILESPLHALYHCIDKVWAPVLLDSGKWSQQVDGKLQQLLTELSTGLAAVVRRDDGGGIGEDRRTDSETTSLTRILTPNDEFQFWADVSMSASKLAVRERAQAFHGVFQSVVHDFANLDSLSFDGALELIEATQDTLDDLWKQTEHDPPYPLERMQHLLSVAGSAFARYVQRRLGDTDIWNGPFSEVNATLQKGLAILDKWTSVGESLTTQYWKRYMSHPWKSDKYVDIHTTQLSARVEEIVSIRTAHEQIRQLLKPEERDELRIKKSFSPFQKMNALQYNPYTKPKWEAAVAQYHRNMVPAEKRIAATLRTVALQGLHKQAHRLLREFKRYKELLKRPVIHTELVQERTTLLGQLSVYMRTLHDDFVQRSSGHQSSAGGDQAAPPKGKNLPEVVNNIVWARGLESNVVDAESTAEALLSDLPAFQTFSTSTHELIEELRSYQRELFSNWSSDMLAAIDSPTEPLGLETSGRLMELDITDGHLKVHYSERLVQLLREARQLTCFGYAVPARIQHTANTAGKFYRHAVILKQVANFYNTIDQQMLKCQHSILLQAALAFEELIKHPSKVAGMAVKTQKKGKDEKKVQVTWDNPSVLEVYISRIQQAAERITTDNRKLRIKHTSLCEKIASLMNVDLLRQQSTWKETIRSMREEVSALAKQGFKEDDMRPWKTHLDYQLYKALEHQYRTGLEVMNEHLPELKVELTYRHQKVQFRPPIEEIRGRYYREMRKFMFLPHLFRGFLDKGSPGNVNFGTMVDKNSQSFKSVYTKAESLFERLEEIRTKFEPMMVLGLVGSGLEMENLIEQYLTEVKDWEMNFKVLKVKGREAETLPNSIKVDCVVVSTSPIKATIDDQIQKLLDALLLTLRRSALRDTGKIDEFLGQALESLSTRPQTTDEIAEAKKMHIRLTEESPDIQPLFALAEEKNQLLRSVAGGGVEAIAQLRTKWDRFGLMLESHELMVKDQVEVMRSNMQSTINAFNNEIEKFAHRWEQLKPGHVDIDSGQEACQDALSGLKDRRTEWDELLKQAEKLREECENFSLPPPDFHLAEQVTQDMESCEQMWKLYEEFSAGLQDLSSQDWISFRSKTYQFDDFLTTWYNRLGVGQAGAEHTDMSVRLTRDVEKYQVLAPLLKYVRGEVLSTDHWVELYGMLGMPKTMTIDKLTFGHYLSVSNAIVDNADKLKELYSRAQGEVSIREALRELEMWGAATTFTLTSYMDTDDKELFIVKDWKELVNQVGDNQCLLQSLKDSPYFTSFADKAQLWEGRLAELDECLRHLNAAQRKWVYLEPIFGRGALPHEQGRFRRVNDDFRSVMQNIRNDSRVVSFVGRTGIKSLLLTVLEQLQRCQKALNEFLEEKRALFPRFYFIGDDDLLEILGQSTNPTVIQTHLKKLFAGIHSVKFDDDATRILAMCSLEGEVVPLIKPVTISKDVEVWLLHLAEEMQITLKGLLAKSLMTSQSSGQAVNPNDFPSQILCLTEYIEFTDHCEAAIADGSLNELLIELETQLEGYTSVDLSSGSSEDGDASKVLDLKLKALILDTIHNIEVVRLLIQEGVKSADNWLWQKQLRFYATDTQGACVMRMVDAEFAYSFEYQGNAPKLVHTPLTDKCYLTMTQGMRMGLGGNPYGPAGTGKTESVKALGGLFGRQVLVFNCDEGIDVQSMGRIFIGLVKCGAWGCFDEFNRLEEAVLSAVSMQIQTIQAAIKTKQESCQLLGREIELNVNSGIFITLNPAGKGYGGRQKLPDNLKQLFRPVAMSKPDNDLIAEVILFSEGFKQAKQLGKKLVEVFSLSKELLSKQQHYDWGLRALKTVLRGSGARLQEEKKVNKSVDPATEVRLIVQALRINTLSKLAFNDSKLFDGLVLDVFPGVKFEDIAYAELREALVKACETMNLEVIDSQIRKALELYEQLRQRMGVVLVGPSGSGKSIVWRILRAALANCNQVVKQYTMNPKAMPRTQLLGHIDMDTREWSDGVLTNSARQVVRESIDVHSWIICDGDIDPEWIESLNSVLDDNRLLTMPSGERIQFGPNINFIFESHDLSCASPATISRMGMIFLSNEDTDVKALVSSWLKSQPTDERSRLEGWLEDYFHRALKYVLEKENLVVQTSLVGLVLNGLSQLKGVTTKEGFACALFRGLGANLPDSIRAELAKEVFQMMHVHAPDSKRLLDTYWDKNGNQLKQYELDVPDAISINDLAPQNAPTPLIRTPAVQRALGLFMPWLEADNRQPFILVGPEGCGKSLLLQHCFRELRSTQVATIHCSSQTTPQHVLQKLSQMCMVISSNTGRVYRPKDCECLILYLRDLNLPKPDKWGTSQLIAFLQQVVTYEGFYDDQLEWVGLEGVQLVASMNPGSSMGRHLLTTRFTSIVRIACINYPSSDQLEVVYSSYLSAVISQQLPTHSVWGAARSMLVLATSMVGMYTKLKSRFTVDTHAHYIFTPRDLTSWTLALLRYDLSLDDGKEHVLQVWAYEACRHFRDRLVAEHQQEFDTMLNSVLQSDWGLDSKKLQLSCGELFYVSWGSTGNRTDHGAQLGRLSENDLSEVIKKGLLSYSRENRDVNILVFTEVLDYICRVNRILTAPSGSLLLAGRSGVGRHTAVELVAHMQRITVISPKISRSYHLKQFHADLKAAMQIAGIDGEDVVLLMDDHHFVEPSFIQLLNSLLSAGEVPGLYAAEELDHLLGPLREKAADDGFRGPLLSYFAQRVKTKLHIVLILDSSASDFVAVCEANPAMYTRCAYQAMECWSDESMLRVPKMLLAPGVAEVTEKTLPGGMDLINGFKMIHDSCTSMKNSTSSRQYMSLMHTYRDVYTKKREGIQQKQSHLQAGVSKLNEAAEHVAGLKEKAGVQSALLAEKQEEADQALKAITAAMEKASDQKQEMEVLKGRQSEEASKLEKRKKAIEVELSEVEPLIKEAKRAVGNIKPESLTEVRSLRAPPETVRDILEGVLRLMGVFDTSWNSMKSFLGKRGIRDEIAQFDARSISPEIRDNVSEILSRSAKSFETKTAMRASQAAGPLAAWVKANVQYSIVLEKIEPLETEQAHLQKNLDKSQRRLEKVSAALDQVDQTVAGLKHKFEKRTTEATRLKIEVDAAKETIDRAEMLLGKLEGEHGRWSEQVNHLSSELSMLPKYTLLASSFIVYLSGAPEDVRQRKLQEWCDKLNVSSGFDFCRFLSTESEQLKWKAEGLPSDGLSIENALVILQGRQVPFLVDPSQQATEWLKTNLKEMRLEVVNQQDSNFTTSLELAVRFGKTLIIQEVDSVEPMLYPLLRKEFSTQGPRSVILIGEKSVDYNEDFRLFLTTRNPSPVISADSGSIVTEVNFTTTRAGLTGQLLALTLQSEKPELEEKKSSLLQAEEEKKVQLADLEESLLQELATAEGNILENHALLDSLNKTKANSTVIQEALKESSRIQVSLDQERDAFLPLAKMASTLFFVISDLYKLNNMYRFSLASFLRLFERTLSTKSDGSVTEVRIKTLSNTLQMLVYEYVCRSLFKADRLMFALHLAHGMHPDLFQPNEWELFTGLLVADMFRRQESMARVRDALPTWLDPERTSAVNLLKNKLQTLYRTLSLDKTDVWSTFIRSSRCEMEFPPSLSKKISLFQQVLVVQALRPDRLQSAMSEFAAKALGLKHLSGGNFSLKRVVTQEAVSSEPILLVVSAGSDPSQDIQELAVSSVGSDRFHQVAMGQGQAEIALRLLSECAANGAWLCLKNLHLVTAWLPTLEKELNSLETVEGFRLFLTAEVHPRFPAILLQTSLKLTYESPPGIRNNLLRTTEAWSPEFLSNGSVTRAQSLFAVAWLHAVVQERRTFIPQGWTKFYEFSQSDLRAATDILERLIARAEGGPIPWEFMHGLMENAIYGGRIDNLFDIDVLRSYLMQYFNKSLFNQDAGRQRTLVQDVNLPASNKLKNFSEIIKMLPDIDKPSYFGLPTNIERSAQRTVSQQVIAQLKVLMRPDVTGGQFDKERWTKELKPVLDLWDKLNQGPDLKKLEKSSPVHGTTESPVGAFLVQERLNAVKLMHVVKADLASLRRVLDGTSLLTAEVQKTAVAMLNHEVPPVWSTLWDGPEDTVQYLRSLAGRLIALDTWLQRVHANQLYKGAQLDMSEIFRPDTFLNALRQQTARQLKCSMDGLKFVCWWKGNNYTLSHQLTISVGELYLEGCTFDGKRLLENERNSPTVAAIPACNMAWVQKSAEDPYPTKDCLALPLYFTADRQRLVTRINVPCVGKPEKWVQCGAALFLKQM